MTISEAIQWTEILATGKYSQDELNEFLSCVQTADSADVNQILDTYYSALNKQENYSLHLQPDFIDRLKSLKPTNEAVADETPVIKIHTHRRWMSMSAAAVLFFAIAGSSYFLLVQKSNHTPAIIAANKDHAPGSNKAILTLADGSQVVLDEAKQGDVAQQSGVKIIKLDSGMLAYTSSEPPVSGKVEVAYNTITTPRGGQYQLILQDGSHVWLNSASSLKFPTAFPGNNRTVELTGEGYFEVAKNASKPFIVSVGKMEVNVLGTHFNVIAYADENAIKTTLLEGSVKVTHGANNALIVPGQQASLLKDADKFNVGIANIDEVIAWKEGKFWFNEMNISGIMRQIARWYDVEVVYEGNLSGITLSGVIPRKKYVSELLEALEMTQKVKFKLEGNKIIVRPYYK